MCGLTVTSWGKPAEGMCDCFYLRAIHSGSWDHNLYWGCTVFMADFGRKRCSGRDRVKRSLKPLNQRSQIKFHHSLARITDRKSNSSPSWAGFKLGPLVFKAAYRKLRLNFRNFICNRALDVCRGTTAFSKRVLSVEEHTITKNVFFLLFWNWNWCCLVDWPKSCVAKPLAYLPV